MWQAKRWPLVLMLMALGPIACAVRPVANAPADRKDFAVKVAEITDGMPADGVVALLGKPDDIRTRTDPEGIGFSRIQEIWAYGTDHHHGDFATLGSVAIDVNHEVQYYAGTSGAENLVSHLGETRLRQLLCILARADSSDISGEVFDPRATIAAVNAVQPLGKKLGVALLREYMRIDLVHGDHQGLMMVMRCLLDSPAVPTTQSVGSDSLLKNNGWLRAPFLGDPGWEPAKISDFPLFPLIIVDGIPLLPMGGYLLAGHAEPVSRYLDYLESAGKWRDDLLNPTNDPLAAYTKLMEMLPPKVRDETVVPYLVAAQLLHLIDTVYRDPSPDDSDEMVFPDKAIAAVQSAMPKVQAMNIRWEAQSQQYVKADGSTLPPTVIPDYRRTILEPKFKDGAYDKVTVTVLRRSNKRIWIAVDVDGSRGLMPTVGVRVVEVTHGNVLVEATNKAALSESTGSISYWSSTSSPRLGAGDKIRVEIADNNEKFVSDLIDP